MSNFTRVRATGMWTVSVLLPSELEKFDANLFKAPNFADGGTYAPSSAITIGGAGLTLTTTLNAAHASLLGNVTIGYDSSYTLNVNAISNFSSTNINGYFACSNGGSFDGVPGDVYAFTVPVNCYDDVTLGSSSADALQVNSASTFAGPITSTVSAQLGSTMAHDVFLAGSLRISGESIPISSDFSITSISHTNVINVSTLTGANRTATLANTTFTANAVRIIKHGGGANTLFVVDALTSTTLASLTAGQCGMFFYLGSSAGWIKLLVG
jgi:hypothetical protein